MARTQTQTAPSKAVTRSGSESSPNCLDPTQTLRAVKALTRKLQVSPPSNITVAKTSLLADADAEDSTEAVPIWLVLTTKQHITDKKRLKPGKITLPNPWLLQGKDAEPLRICLITADPQRQYKDLVASPGFPEELRGQISRVIGTEKLKAKFSSFESKRKLLSEHDVFLADDRIITLLPTLLGKVFYKVSAKRPVPISLEGKRQSIDKETGLKRVRLADGGKKVEKLPLEAKDMAAEIQRALGAALVHLAPSATTAVKVGTAAQTVEQLQDNITTVVDQLVEKYVPQQWKNVRAVHVKGPDTAALPIWLTGELWVDEKQVWDEEKMALEEGKGKKRKRGGEDFIEVPGPDGKMRRVERPGVNGEVREKKRGKKTKELAAPVVPDEEAAEIKTKDKEEKAARKEALKAQKEALKSPAMDPPAGNEDGAATKKLKTSKKKRVSI